MINRVFTNFSGAVFINRSFEVKIFISYSHQNEEMAENLISLIDGNIPNTFAFFKAKSNLLVNIRSMEFGDWLEKIRKEIIDADIIIGSITEEYLHSKWLFSEVGGAILFNKLVVPICYTPVDKKDLPSPFNSVQAYNYNSEDMSKFLFSLAKSANKNISPHLKIEVDNFKDVANFSDALSIMNSIEGFAKVQEMIRQRKITGGFLASLFNNYSVSLYMESEILSDEHGSCFLSRDIRIVPSNHIIHWYYELYSEGFVKIEEIIDIENNVSLKSLVHEKSNKHIRISILFDRVIKRGEEIKIRIKSYAEYYFSDLIKSGLSQTYYNNVFNTRIKQYSQRFIFPNTNQFRNLEGFIISAGSKKDMYKKINPTLEKNKKMIEIDLKSKRGFTDRVLIELRK